GAVWPDVECVLTYGAPRAYPRVLDGLRRLGDRRPPVAMWQTEPFLHPKASGLPWPRRTPQEWAKILLRDKRAIDGRTNERALVRLQADGLVDLVATSTRGRQERQAEVGVEARLIQMAVRPRE